jgi:hypothetical protein
MFSKLKFHHQIYKKSHPQIGYRNVAKAGIASPRLKSLHCKRRLYLDADHVWQSNEKAKKVSPEQGDQMSL